MATLSDPTPEQARVGIYARYAQQRVKLHCSYLGIDEMSYT